MKWVTGHVRCQVTGKKPTRNNAAPPGPRLAERPNRPRLSQPCSKLIAANQANMPGITVRRKDIVTSLTGGGPIHSHHFPVPDCPWPLAPESLIFGQSPFISLRQDVPEGLLSLPIGDRSGPARAWDVR